MPGNADDSTATFVASPLLPTKVRGTTNHVLASISDWWATFATLAGLEASDNCVGCVPLDGKDLWPAITGASDPAELRTELLLGVGGTLSGALRSGTYKLIAPGGNSRKADGYSAQYPGSTAHLAAPPDGSCAKAPCLFDLQADPREVGVHCFHSHQPSPAHRQPAKPSSSPLIPVH